MIKLLVRYAKIWWVMSIKAFITVFSQGLLISWFLVGKILRFVFFFSFLYFLLKTTKSLAGYDSDQVIFFFLTFNVVDVIAQFLFREVYRFRPLVVSGDLDLILVKPINTLFRVLMGGADVIDLLTIPPLLFVVWWVGKNLSPTPGDVVLYIFLIVNALIIAAAFHIAVLALGIITLEVDHTIMIYRDLKAMGRLPIDIYREPLKSTLTFLVPVGIMITLPAKALMGLVTLPGVLGATAIGILSFFVSLRFWNFALKKYSSASS